MQVVICCAHTTSCHVVRSGDNYTTFITPESLFFAAFGVTWVV